MERKPVATTNGEEESSSPSPHPATKIGPYDVLLSQEENSNSSSSNNNLDEDNSGPTATTTTLRLLACPHVGNNRLEVLLLMNRHEYEERLTAGMDTSPVLHKLADIVTQQCVPPGRFLLAKNKTNTTPTDRGADGASPASTYDEYQWEELALDRAHQFLEAALCNAETAGLAGAGSGSFLSSPTTSTNTPTAIPPPPPPSKEETSAAENKKRFRRSSLLRRSVSESFVRKVQQQQPSEGGGGARGGAFRASEFGKKKAANRHSSKFWTRQYKLNQAPLVEQPETLDVLLNYEQTALVPNHVGNNRLRVLLNLHKEKYQESDETEQTSSLQEWIRTVTQFWGGRFLRQADEGSSTYEVLDANQAELALHSVISELSSTAGDDPTPLAQPSAMTASSSSSKPVLAAVDSAVPTPTHMDVHHMRSAAVQSLQKRKKRQGVVGRLRRLATNTLTRNTSASAATGRGATNESSSSSHMTFPRHSSAPSFTMRDGGGGGSSSIPGFSNGDDHHSVPAFTHPGSAAGITSLPTSPTPLSSVAAIDPVQEQRARRSLSITLPRFRLSGRAAQRRQQNLVADGVGRDLRQSLEAGYGEHQDWGPEAFGESPNPSPR